jgi:hypothetical protein
LEQEFLALELLMQLSKCVAWFPHAINHFILVPFGFLTLDLGFRILGALMGFRSFIESFMVEAFHEDLRTISILPMLANP